MDLNISSNDSPKLEWFKLQPGNNLIRILESPSKRKTHFDYETKHIQNCLGNMELCSRCAKGERSRPRYKVKIFDRRDQKEKFFEFGTAVMRQMGSIVLDKGDPSFYDLNIIHNPNVIWEFCQVYACPKNYGIVYDIIVDLNTNLRKAFYKLFLNQSIWLSKKDFDFNAPFRIRDLRLEKYGSFQIETKKIKNVTYYRFKPNSLNSEEVLKFFKKVK